MEIIFTDEAKSIADYDFSNNLVGLISTVTDKGFCNHAGILIHYDDKISIFHFNGNEVLLQEAKQEELGIMLFKKLEIVHEYEVPAFLGFCKDLLDRGVSPSYGFLFDKGYYDPYSKESYIKNTKIDITTCVGFCIKVIRGFIYTHEEYIKLDDWNIESLNTSKIVELKSYLDGFAEYLQIDSEELYQKDDIKRIKPSELLASTYFGDLPIEKVRIDSKLEIISNKSLEVSDLKAV